MRLPPPPPPPSVHSGGGDGGLLLHVIDLSLEESAILVMTL